MSETKSSDWPVESVRLHGGIGVPISFVAAHTTDVERFLLRIPTVLQLLDFKGNPYESKAEADAWLAIIGKGATAADLKDVMLTFDEHNAMTAALQKEIDAVTARITRYYGGEWPPGITIAEAFKEMRRNPWRPNDHTEQP